MKAKDYLSKVSCKYGAPMGRPCNETPIGTCNLIRIPLDSGGYDQGGAYWGHGEKLYGLFDQWGRNYFTRAKDRNTAKLLFSGRFPNITYYR